MFSGKKGLRVFPDKEQQEQRHHDMHTGKHIQEMY